MIIRNRTHRMAERLRYRTPRRLVAAAAAVTLAIGVAAAVVVATLRQEDGPRAPFSPHRLRTWHSMQPTGTPPRCPRRAST